MEPLRSKLKNSGRHIIKEQKLRIKEKKVRTKLLPRGARSYFSTAARATSGDGNFDRFRTQLNEGLEIESVLKLPRNLPKHVMF